MQYFYRVQSGDTLYVNCEEMGHYHLTKFRLRLKLVVNSIIQYRLGS